MAEPKGLFGPSDMGASSDDDDGLRSVAGRMLSAFQNDDESALVSALRSFKKSCKGEPEADDDDEGY